jgi:hypothetical protein
MRAHQFRLDFAVLLDMPNGENCLSGSDRAFSKYGGRCWRRLGSSVVVGSLLGFAFNAFVRREREGHLCLRNLSPAQERAADQKYSYYLRSVLPS